MPDHYQGENKITQSGDYAFRKEGECILGYPHKVGLRTMKTCTHDSPIVTAKIFSEQIVYSPLHNTLLPIHLAEYILTQTMFYPMLAQKDMKQSLNYSAVKNPCAVCTNGTVLNKYLDLSVQHGCKI